MIEHILGWSTLLGIGIYVMVLSKRYTDLSLVLPIAFLVRAFAALFHFYVAPLPDGTTDAVTLEETAWDWGRKGFFFAFEQLIQPDSYFYSWLLSLVYALTSHSVLMAQGISVFAGVCSVYLVWVLTRELWEGDHAKKAAWVAALFPTLILYSALTMREVFVIVFLLLGLIALVRWARSDSTVYALLTLAGLAVATLFHGGMFVAILAFFVLLTIRNFKLWLAALQRARLRLFATVLLVLVFVSVSSFVVIGFRIPKLGTPEQMVDIQRTLNRFEFSSRGEAKYPEWTVPRSGTEMIWKIPVRTAYFLFAPFFWDLERPKHLIGWFDGMLYLIITFLIWRNRRAIWSEPGARAVFLTSLATVVVFGLATGNFGTSLRHRAKFVVAAIALVAPRLPKLSYKPSSVTNQTA